VPGAPANEGVHINVVPPKVELWLFAHAGTLDVAKALHCALQVRAIALEALHDDLPVRLVGRRLGQERGRDLVRLLALKEACTRMPHRTA
jgi:hypothetical protein